jgi:hypothetical protein
MTLRGVPVPPSTRSAQKFQKLFRSPPLNHTYSWGGGVSRRIWWYTGHDITGWFRPLDIGSAQISRKPFRSDFNIFYCNTTLQLDQAQVLKNLDRPLHSDPHPKPYIFLFLVSRRLWLYGVVPYPLNRRYFNILKTVDIPTLNKPYIFLFLLSRSIWWYAYHNHTKWSRPPSTGGAAISWKPLRSPTTDYIYSYSLCQVTCDGM